jgi:beta-N-acetylhexosaminidase
MGAVSATVLGVPGPVLQADEAAFYREADPWGFILFARNIENPDQVTRLTGALRDAVGRDAPVMIDQEGGRVQRMRAPHWREWLPPLDHVARVAPGALERSLWLRGRLIAGELRAVGIDVDCVPTCDIAGPETHPFLRNRCFGTDAATIIPAARAVADGLMAGGVLPVIKHMPGHGRAAVDSHHEVPRVTAAREVLETTDFAVFRALNDLPLGMTGHIVFDAVDPGRAATASPVVVDLIRHGIGFDGLLLTDDLSMQALRGTLPERAAAAIAAGCDIALHCNGTLEEMAGVVAAAGALTGRGAERAAAAVARRDALQAVPPLDLAALDVEFAGIAGAAVAHA